MPIGLKEDITNVNSISVIIPAWDEEGGIRQTIGGIPRSEFVVSQVN